MVAKLRGWVLALCLLSVSAVAHSETRPGYGQRVVASLLEEPLRVDPTEVQTHTDITVVGLMFDTLYELQDGAIVPHLASAMPEALAPLVVRIPLRTGVLFHDGRILLAGDVVLSVERLGQSDYGFLVDNIVSIVPDGTSAVVIQLRSPDVQLAKLFCDVHTAITPMGERPTFRKAIGTGPFVLKVRSASRRELQLAAFEAHFSGRSYLDSLQLRWYEHGKAEARNYETGTQQLSLRGDIAFAGHRPKYQSAAQNLPADILVFLGFGTADPLVAERVFRHALLAAIGPESFVEIGSGEEVIPLTSASNSIRVDGLLERLAQSYSKLKRGGVSLDLLVNSSRPDDGVVAGKIASALFSYGIAIRVVSLRPKAFVRRVGSGQCDLYIGQLGQSSLRLRDQLLARYAVAHAQNSVESLQGANSQIVQRRVELELPIIPLYRRGLLVHHRSDVKGLEHTAGLRLRFEELYYFGDPEKNQ